MYSSYEKYGFVINEIRNQQQWDLIKANISHTPSRENKYSWAISYDYKGDINMREWDNVMCDIFKRKDIPINHLTRLVKGLENNFTWELPKIEFEEYGIIK